VRKETSKGRPVEPRQLPYLGATVFRSYPNPQETTRALPKSESCELALIPQVPSRQPTGQNGLKVKKKGKTAKKNVSSHTPPTQRSQTNVILKNHAIIIERKIPLNCTGKEIFTFIQLL